MQHIDQEDKMESTVESPLPNEAWIEREAAALVERIEAAVLERLKAEASA